MKADHVPEFSTHILAAFSLDKFVDVKFLRHFKSYQGCFMFEPKPSIMIFETRCIGGLYRIKISILVMKTMMSNRLTLDMKEVMRWHERTGHLSADRYIALTEQDQSVEKFDR